MTFKNKHNIYWVLKLTILHWRIIDAKTYLIYSSLQLLCGFKLVKPFVIFLNIKRTLFSSRDIYFSINDNWTEVFSFFWRWWHSDWKHTDYISKEQMSKFFCRHQWMRHLQSNGDASRLNSSYNHRYIQIRDLI